MLRESLGKELLFLDGAMGTVLQREGLISGEAPELWNIKRPDAVKRVHAAYLSAGSDIILTNTFGANRVKMPGGADLLRDTVRQGVRLAKDAAVDAARKEGSYLVALDIGPTGKLLKPLGDLSFEDAYDAFFEAVTYGKEAGADIIYIETMTDLYEAKAAVLAAKEACDLPVFATVTFDEKGRLLTGGDIPSAVAMLEGLRVDALGVNCGMGPAQVLRILPEIVRHSSVPVIVKPNAGLPVRQGDETVYDVSPELFAKDLKATVNAGAHLAGGCCGTTPEHIAAAVKSCRHIRVKPIKPADETVVSSYAGAVFIGDDPVIIGERINPTGKSRLKQALLGGDYDTVLKEGIVEQEAASHILDVNVGLPGIDERAVLKETVTRLQSVIRLPLQIDTSNPEALKDAMRAYNGKPMVNSVNASQKSMDNVFPPVAKYGGVVVGLTLDEKGIPDTAEGRCRLAGKIIEEAARYGIPKKDIVIDTLTMAVSADPDSAKITLDAMSMVRERYGVNTLLGVSNVSFGLPARSLLNASFYLMALERRLSAAIINPLSDEMMGVYRSFRALSGLDKDFKAYIGFAGDKKSAAPTREMSGKGGPRPRGGDKDGPVRVSDKKGKPASAKEKPPSEAENSEGEEEGASAALKSAIINGLKEEAGAIASLLTDKLRPMDVINSCVVPALDEVGDGFEAGRIFLPQLLMSAEAAKAAFSALKEKMTSDGVSRAKGEKILLATVKGDIHDIGKNIVKVLLENYGYDVIDMGKDVPPEDIVRETKAGGIKLVGLSALMTTTVESMKETIRQLKAECEDVKVMVGGAVLTREYAAMIGADFYSKDATQSVKYAREVFGE